MDLKYSHDEFYQAKYTYYKKMVRYIIYTSCIASFFYWFTDCMLYARISYETLIPRSFIFIPMFIYAFIQRKTNNYKINVIASYIVVHFIIFCTEWAVFHLENRTHANEGLMVIECIFIFMGVACPKKYSIIAHSLVMLDIIIANMFIHYDDFITIIALHIILIIGSEVIVDYMETVFKERFYYEKCVEYTNFHDQLTGVYNRNIMSTLVDKSNQEFMNKNLGIMMLDIDYFKNINDTYGHDVGDEILKRFVNIINQEIRHGDVFIRWGGEEFLVLIERITKEGLANLAVRFNQSVKEELKDYDVTVSIGGTLYRCGDYHTAIKRADKALYSVKENGRNGFKIV